MSMNMTRLDPPDVDGDKNYNRCECGRFVALYEVEEHWAIGAMMGSEPGDDFHTVTKKAPCAHCDRPAWNHWYQCYREDI